LSISSLLILIVESAYFSKAHQRFLFKYNLWNASQDVFSDINFISYYIIDTGYIPLGTFFHGDLIVMNKQIPDIITVVT